ncbi:hypothetical protein HU200_066551 [Digitaria exilis]|uniref:Uncharacterized protein n=1 Tax=Digitaria exilis TaxID=1010633 RepID=A0A834ZWH4_9POAL|nr:hypothetical protein HU200_066551 [Digitaria exilis]
MQAVRPAAEEEQQEQVVREEAAAEVKMEVGKEAAHQEEEEEAAPEEKDVAVVGEEAEAEGEGEIEAEGEAGASAKKNRIQVSTNKKPLYFYVNLAKRYMQNYDEVELSALGMGNFFSAPFWSHFSSLLHTWSKVDGSVFSVLGHPWFAAIGTVVTVAEILKNNGLATEKKILTSTIGTKDESKGRLIEILLCKSENFNSIMSSKKSDRPKSSEDEIKV